MIQLERVATLDVSAASGLVSVGEVLVVIADDALMLSRYTQEGQCLGRVRLFEGELPDEPKPRKRMKPDLEALARLPDGRLLALGSGSKKRRDRAALIDQERVTEVDLEPLYDRLREILDRLNVEGAAVWGLELVLLTRRTGARGKNAVVRLDLPALVADLDRQQHRVDSKVLLGVLDVDLGEVEGVPLGFTDAAPYRDGLLFAAAAEVTDDPVDDGAVVGCGIGWLDGYGRLAWLEPVEPPVKLEGITVVENGILLAVADADDPEVPAPLFRARLP